MYVLSCLCVEKRRPGLANRKLNFLVAVNGFTIIKTLENLFYDEIHSSLILTNNFPAQEIVQNVQVIVFFLVWGFHLVGVGIFFSLARADI